MTNKILVVDDEPNIVGLFAVQVGKEWIQCYCCL
jgi:hypothetical protein